MVLIFVVIVGLLALPRPFHRTVYLAHIAQSGDKRANTIPPSRTSSQKPGDEFYANFRQHFPQVGTVPASEQSSGNTSLDIPGGVVQQRCVLFLGLGLGALYLDPAKISNWDL